MRFYPFDFKFFVNVQFSFPLFMMMALVNGRNVETKFAIMNNAVVLFDSRIVIRKYNIAQLKLFRNVDKLVKTCIIETAVGKRFIFLRGL